MNKEVFISHSSTDVKEATRICDYFEKNYINCFFAPRDIKVGNNYAEELIDGIDNSKVMILMLSNESNNSPHVIREVERAVSRSIPIVVYRLEFVELSKSMEYFLMTNQWRESKKSDDLSELYSIVKGVIREKDEDEFDALEKNLKMEMLREEAELNKTVITLDDDRSNLISEQNEKAVEKVSEKELERLEELTPLVSAEDIIARTEQLNNVSEQSIELIEEVQDEEYEDDKTVTNNTTDSAKKEKFLKIFAVSAVAIIVALVVVIVAITSGNKDKSNIEGNSESVVVNNEASSNVKEENSSTDKENTSSKEDEEESTTENMVDSEYDKELRGTKLIAIDAALQATENREQEAIGPGATETKNKMGTSGGGINSAVLEYELNLQIALKLEEELEKRGYEVFMIRKSNNVNISNAGRAELANTAGADVLIRIDANSSSDLSVSGAMTICPTENNLYNSDIYSESKVLSEFILDELVEATDCKKQYVWETDTMAFVNWSKVPVTIVEVGYLSNVEEDTLLVTEEYQEKIAVGIANGIDKAILTS